MSGSGFKLEEAVGRKLDLEDFGRPSDVRGALMAPSEGRVLIDDLAQALQVSSSGARVIDNRLREGRFEDGRKLLTEVETALTTASDLVQRARKSALYVRNGRVEVSAAMFSLGRTMRLMLGRDHALAITVPVGLPPIECVEAELQIAIIELVTTLRDAMDAGGEIMIDVRHAIRPDFRVRSAVEIRVVGSGQGPYDVPSRPLLESYFRSKRGVIAGDIGFPMAEKLVRGLGGFVAIEDVSGFCTIALYLPTAGDRQAVRQSM